MGTKRALNLASSLSEGQANTEILESEPSQHSTAIIDRISNSDRPVQEDRGSTEELPPGKVVIAARPPITCTLNTPFPCRKERSPETAPKSNTCTEGPIGVRYGSIIKERPVTLGLMLLFLTNPDHGEGATQPFVDVFAPRSSVYRAASYNVR